MVDNIADLAAARERRGGPPPDGGPRDDRVVVRVTAGDEQSAVDEAEAAVLAKGGLYAHGGALVEVREQPVPVAGGVREDAVRLSRLSPVAIMERMQRACTFEKWDNRSESWARRACPSVLPEMLLARDGNWRAPPLMGVVTAPTLRPDGSLLDRAGYDEATGLLFWPRGVEFPHVAARPSEAEARAALAEIKHLFRTFAFVGPGDLAVALSCMLTASVRRSLETVPVHAFTAPDKGAGKSKSVDVCSIVATGNRAAVTSASVSKQGGDQELDKRLGASLLAGDQFIALDNVEHPVGGELMCQIVTQPTVKIRPLGLSQNVVVPTGAMLTVTGNNMQIAGDMTRRVVMATIDPKVERPEFIRYDSDPLAEARASRPRLAAAALTVLLGWIATGQDTRSRVLNGFEAWSRLIGGALTWLGEADPLDVMEEVRATDPRLQRLQDVMRAWGAHFGGEAVPVRRVAEACEARRSVELDGPSDADGRRPTKLEWTNAELREAVVAVTGDKGTQPITSEKLLWWLRKNAGKVVDGCSFAQERGETQRTAVMWRLTGYESPSDDIPL